ncbi:hypothetical protein JTB14_026309 [Gonioctena quinquepunctata]|nr:hypothetical protein JTB14_026309 [Gonioctena quinquepunctata]
MLGFIKRTACDSTNTTAIKSLYFSLVRSHLDYCSTVWSPHYVTYKVKLEAVQHNLLRYIAFKLCVYYGYGTLEHMLNIPSLEVRRKQRDSTLLFKIINWYQPLPLSKYHYLSPLIQPDRCKPSTFPSIDSNSHTTALSLELFV